MKYNFSSLDAAQRCYQYYKYVYIDKETTDAQESSALHFGSALHMGLEQILAGEDGKDSFKIYWDSLKEKTLTYYGQDSWEKLDSIGPVFLDRFKRLHSSKIKPIAVEQTLETDLDEFVVYGTPDVIGEFQGVPSIIDFKTSGYPYEKGKIEMSEQMYLYAYMAQKVLNYPVHQLVYTVFVKGGLEPRIQTLQFDLTPAKLESMLGNVKAWIKELHGRTEFPKNRKGCMMGKYKCQFWSKCYA